jgi:hypothetical protein
MTARWQHARAFGKPAAALVSPDLQADGGVFVSLMQVYAFLAIAYAFEIDVPPVGYIAVAPALLLTGMMLGAIGLLLSSLIRQLENFAAS